MTIDRRRDGDLAITDRSIELRRRKREIVHIIHHTTWIMETLGVVIGFVFRFVGRSDVYPNIFANLIFIQNLASAEILVPFTHLFNEHRIKVMVLERGWIFAIKNALNSVLFIGLHRNQILQPEIQKTTVDIQRKLMCQWKYCVNIRNRNASMLLVQSQKLLPKIRLPMDWI